MEEIYCIEGLVYTGPFFVMLRPVFCDIQERHLSFAGYQCFI